MWCLMQCVIDGDMCEQFNSLDSGKKEAIATDLDRTTSEVCLKGFQLLASSCIIFLLIGTGI